MNKNRSLLCCLFLLAVGLVPAGDAKGRSRLDDQPSLAVIHDLQAQAGNASPAYNLSVSNDGQSVAFVYANRIWISRRGSPAAVPLLPMFSDPSQSAAGTKDWGMQPQISPDGHWVAFWLSAGGTRQLWLAGVDGTAPRPLTRVPGGILAPTANYDAGAWDPGRIDWSADSRKLVFAAATARSARSDIKDSRDWLLPPTNSAEVTIYRGSDRAADPLGDSLYPMRKMRIGATASLVQSVAIHVFDVGRNTDTTLESATDGDFSPVWLPSGNSILFKGRDANQGSSWISARPDLYLRSLTTNNIVRLTNDPSVEENPIVSPDGSKVAYVSRPGELLGFPKVCVAAIAEKMNVRCATSPVPYGGPLAWKDNNEVVAGGINGNKNVLDTIDVTSMRVVASHVVAGEVKALASAAGMVLSSEDRPRAEAVVSARSQGAERVLFTSSNPYSAGFGVRQLSLKFKGGDGDEVFATLYLPSSDDGARLPLVVNTYPSSANPRFARQDQRLLASQGYASLIVDSRSSHTWPNFFGPESHYLKARGRHGLDLIVQDIEGALDAAIQTGRVDQNRICGIGFSNGGGVLAQYLARSSRLKCAIVQSPASIDLFNSYYLGSANQAFWSTLVGSSPASNPQLYYDLMPTFHADHIKTPTLLTVGDQDGSTLLAQLGLYGALRAGGAPTDLIVYHKQGHGFSGAAREDVTLRQLLFLQRFLDR